MSARELRRAGVLAVSAKTLPLKAAAELMDVSYRQAKRLYQRYRASGAKGLKHRSAGRRSNRAVAPRQRTRVLALIRAKYSGRVDDRFGPTLAAEHLASEDGLTVHHETLRRWMLAAGLWSRARKRTPHRRRRARMAHRGELVHLDGSFHPWFEDRGPAACLLTLVDDATGTTLGQFSAQETIWAAVAVLRLWITRYGVPRALYTDWKNVYVRVPNAEERDTGAPPLTQFGRMCAALGIRIIPASSPQGKGRIERNHGTHQDRLVKKLRRRGVRDLVTANAFLAAEYWADHMRDLLRRRPPDRLGNSEATGERRRTETRKGGSAMESGTARADRSPLARPAARRRVPLARGRRRHPYHSADARTRQHPANAALLERDRRGNAERAGGELEERRPTASPGVGKLIGLVWFPNCPRFLPGNWKFWLRGLATY